MLQRVRLLPAMPASHIGATVQVSAILFPTKLPSFVARQLAEDGPSAWAPVTHKRDLGGVEGSGLILSKTWMLWLFRGVDHCMEDSFLLLSLHLCVCHFAHQIHLFFKKRFRLWVVLTPTVFSVSVAEWYSLLLGCMAWVP